MHEDQPAIVAGIYTQPYNEIVRPERVWKIGKYFLRRWTPYLSPSEVWLVIGARQLSYFNERRPWFRAYDRTLAEAAGLHVKVFRRTIKKAICDGKGAISAFLQKTADPQYTRSDGVTRQTQTRYTIRLDDPLAPGDAAALAYWLRRNSPQSVTAQTVQRLLEEAVTHPARVLQAAESAAKGNEGPALLAVADVVAHVFPSLNGAEQGRAWREAADALHTHLVTPELAHFETQYFRRHWMPLLGPGPALLLTYLRSLCYLNEESGEIRDEVALQSGQLENMFQVSSRTLRRWFGKLDELSCDDAAAGRFVHTVAATKQPDQKVLTTYRIALRTPLTPDDLKVYRQRLAANDAGTPYVTDEKFPTLAASGETGNGHKVPYRQSGDGQKVPHKVAGDGQKVAHSSAGNGQEVVHTSDGGGQKVAHTMMGNGQEVPNTVGGDGQNVAGSATEKGSYKYYKILLEALGLQSFEDLKAQSPPQEQQHWLWADGRAHSAYAAVVAQGSPAALLDRLGVQEPARSEILAQHVGQTEAVAWMLYALQQSNLERPLSYVISRLSRGDPPPLDFVQLASLSWEQWRAYAWAWHMRTLPQAILAQFETAPLFAEWGQVYGPSHPDDLPFDVGAGLTALTARPIEDERDSLPHNTDLLANERNLWQAALEELSLQMTRATFDAWLRDARLLACEHNCYVVAVSRPEARDWLQNRLQETVERTVHGVTEGRVERVQFVVEAEGAPR